MQTPLKTCSRCGIEKPTDDFALRMSTAKGLVPRTYCKECDVPQRLTPEQTHRKLLMRRYGITPEELTQMSVAQDGMCAICSADIIAAPYVDHDHETGKVRKLLCLHCNLGLGHFFDNTEHLKKAIEYLQRHE